MAQRLGARPLRMRFMLGRGANFEGRTDDGHTAMQLLEEHGILDIDVVGLATDYCVRASALDAIAAGRRVRVFTDLVEGVHAESSERSLAEIAHAGAKLEASV